MNGVITKNVRRPGQAGTLKYMRLYGEDLVCVRYKYDYKRRKRYKTVELIIDQSEWSPRRGDTYPHRRVYVQLDKPEIELRKKVKAAGGIWNGYKKLWKVSLQAVWDLDLEDRIVNERYTSRE